MHYSVHMHSHTLNSDALHIHMHKSWHIPKCIFKQTKWVVLLFLFMRTKYPHTNILAESIHRLDAAIHFITPTHLHWNGRLRQLVYWWQESMHALTHAYRKHFRELHDQIYIIICKSPLFSCVWYHLMLSRLCTLSFSTHLHIAMCISQFLTTCHLWFWLCGFSILHTSLVRASYTFVLTTQEKKKRRHAGFSS